MNKKEGSPKQNCSISHERRISERREKDCPGYTYITTVGWICRRENIRRKDNNSLFKDRL